RQALRPPIAQSCTYLVSGMDAFPLSPSRDSLRRAHGRLAGFLFIATATLSVPAGLVIDPPPPAASYLLSLAVGIIGVALLLAPWERMGDRWLHVVTLTGTAAVTASLIVFSLNYRALYFVVL